MSDFKSLLADLAQGNVSIETVRSWIDDALAEGTADSESLLALLESAAEILPPDLVDSLKTTITSGNAGSPDAPLEFDFDIRIPEPEEATVTDSDRTVADPDTAQAGARADAEIELSLVPLTEEEAAEQAAAQAAAAAEKTQIVDKGDDEKTQMMPPPGEEKTQVIPRGAEKTRVMPDADAEATVLNDPDATPGAGRAFDPFAMSDSTTPAASAPTGTGWPTNTGFTGGRGSGLDPRNIGPGTILKERFELLSAIGEGGMGMVYKARDLLKVEAKDRNPYIAVKLLSGDFREHPEAFIALQRESSKAQKLAHPNITTVYDFDRDGATVYLTMELMEGEELAKFIKKLPAGGLPTDEALGIIKQLCDGLEYAHARNLVHSDFKPGNCFFLKDGTVKILDFGIARASTTRSDAQGETTVFDPGQLGALTPAYATPEMFEGLDPAAGDDIYALACVAYELLTGKHPFNKLSSVKAMEKGLSPAPITHKPGFTKRQQKVLFKALAFRREDRTKSVVEFWEGIQFKKNNLPYYLAAGVAGALLISALAYKPIIETIEDNKNAEIITALEQGSRQVPDVLANLGQFSERARGGLLEDGKDIIIGYYQQRAEALVDESQGNYDFPAAFREIDKVREYYPDSAQVQTLETNLTDRRNTLISQLNSTFDAYLTEDRLLPLESEDDITDVLDKLRQAAPENALLDDARLSARYAELAEGAIKANAWDRAAEYLAAGLAYAPKDALLLNLDDQVSRELKRQADAKLVADIKGRLDAQRGALNSIDGYIAAVDDINRLTELRPDDALLGEILGPLRETVSARIQALAGAGDFAAAEELLFTFARQFSVSELLGLRENLSRAEINAGYQPGNLSDALQALNQRRVLMDELLGQAAFNNEWNDALAKQFKETIALLRPGNTWFEEMQQRIVNAYVQQAQSLIQADRFDAARRMLDIGETFRPDLPVFDQQRVVLADAEAQFKREQEERLRLARIDALKNTLVTQANANEVANAVRTLESLRDDLPASDVFVTTTGPVAIAQAYLRLANSQAERGNFSNAMSFAREGLQLAPDMQGLKDAVALFGNQARRQELMELASSATSGSVGRLPAMLEDVQKLFPADATAIANETVRNLAARIENLESSDVIGANELLDAAKRLFPGNEALAEITLRQPPRPSQYVPAGREALNNKQLTAAEEILATAQREEPGHQQVAAFAKELADAKSTANEYFDEYRRLMLQGQKTQAKRYLDYALTLWTDSERYQQELASNFTTTRAPTRAADGSKPCTASLAGYGRSGRAVCYDMVADGVRGPEMIVVPAGSGFAEPFAIGKYEVSVSDYNNYCTASGKCAAIDGNADLPVTNVSFTHMQGYVQWLSQVTGASYRIPTEAEWIYAANANNPDAVKDFNCRVTQGGQVIKGLTMLETRSGRSNPWGLTNYAGNVQELVRAGSGVTARGGAFRDNLSNCGIQFVRTHTGAADEVTGFRVARNTD
ncbi:MAG TPA: bifunctional serine/threonine-protein kinase/formylglycine-generating enzyme family protein [Gammaproteobacteria bacterium]